MKFLIICTYFPPDTSIAAVRPYMFAKYLYEFGHQVTILRSGEFHRAPDPESPQLDHNIRIVSFLGEQSDAELFQEGKYIEKKKKHANKNAFIPYSIRNRLIDCYDFLSSKSRVDARLQEASLRLEKQKAAIDKLKNEGAQFDIVFSTYSELENVYAGEYAADLFKAKWIMDFRDPIVAYHAPIREIYWNRKVETIQQHAIDYADLCTTATEGITEKYKRLSHKAKVVTLNNGYQPEEIKEINDESSAFAICYTGQLYTQSSRGLALALASIKKLKNEISFSNLRFVYAGPNSSIVKQLFRENSLEELLEDHGYVTRSEAQELQNKADLFLVLSWNTRKSQGVITGKFYEGIRAEKPILSIVTGDVPQSELKLLNDKYHYGYCYEEGDKKSEVSMLSEYIKLLYEEKMRTGRVIYTPSEELKNAFRYDILTQKLVLLSERLMEKDCVD